jgi:hypothetical protein
LEETAALGPRPFRPSLGEERDARAPLAAHGDAGHEAQAEHHPEGGGERGQAAEERIEEDGPQHHALAADIIGQHAADEATQTPAEQGAADRDAGPDRPLRQLLWRQQRFQHRRQDQDQGEGFEAVEDPAHETRDQDAPMHRFEARVPWRVGRGDTRGCNVVHVSSRAFIFAAGRYPSGSWGGAKPQLDEHPSPRQHRAAITDMPERGASAIGGSWPKCRPFDEVKLFASLATQLSRKILFLLKSKAGT